MLPVYSRFLLKPNATLFFVCFDKLRPVHYYIPVPQRKILINLVSLQEKSIKSILLIRLRLFIVRVFGALPTAYYLTKEITVCRNH